MIYKWGINSDILWKEFKLKNLATGNTIRLYLQASESDRNVKITDIMHLQV